jgi:iron complex outermembrane receptor protein
LSRRDIELSGARNLAELLHGQSVMLGFGESGGLNWSGLGGQVSAAIHGYEAGTLVLLNGQRLAPFPAQRVDKDVSLAEISQIPLNAVERIDILVDGASARYGSDAIAGVVNIITRHHTRQADISVHHTQADGRGGAMSDVQFSWGRGRLESEGQAFQIHASVSEHAMQLARDRRATDTAPQLVGTDAQGQAQYVLPFSLPGPSIAPGSACPEAYFPSPPTIPVEATRACRYDLSQWLSVYPSEQRRSLFASYERALNKDHVVFIDQLLHQEAQAFKVGAPWAAHGFNWAAWAPAMLPTGSPERTRDKSNWRSNLGLRGQWAGTEYRLGLVLGQASMEERAWQPDLSTLPSSPPATAAPLQAQGLALDRSSTQLAALQAQLSGQWADWPAGTPRWGAGWSVQQERHQYRNLARNAIADDAVDVQRQQWAVFSELNLPLRERTEANVSFRFDDLGISGNAWTGKVGLKQRVGLKGFLRGSLGTGFRAPSPMQSLPLAWTTLSRIDPVNCAANPGSVCSRYVAVGNPALQAERSRQFWLGYHNEPSPRWSFGVDYWRFTVSDIFGALSRDDILNNPEFKALYYQESSPGVPAQYTGLNQNLGQLQRSGLDYRLQHRLPTDWGRVRVSLHGTRYLHAQRSTYPGRPAVSELGQYLDQTQSFIPKNQLNLTASLERDQHAYSLVFRHITGHSETAMLLLNHEESRYPVRRYVNSNWRIDFNGRYQASSKLTWLFGVDNLLDRDPSPTYQHPNAGSLPVADTRYGDYRGRRLKVGLKLGI